MKEGFSISHSYKDESLGGLRAYKKSLKLLFQKTPINILEVFDFIFSSHVLECRTLLAKTLESGVICQRLEIIVSMIITIYHILNLF